MKNEVINKVDQYIQQMAESLGVAAEHVYGILVKQQIVFGVMSVGGALLSLTLLILFLMFISKAFKEADIEETNYRFSSSKRANNFYGSVVISMREGYPTYWFPLGMLAILTLILLILAIISGIPHILNPEYYAIKEIMDVFK